jgi:hypothetical protein
MALLREARKRCDWWIEDVDDPHREAAESFISGLCDWLDEVIAAKDALQAPPDGATLEQAIAAVASEEELDGPMPDSVLSALQTFGPTEFARSIVRATKRSITAKLEALTGEATGGAE